MKLKIRINWKCFEDNTSTIEELEAFVDGGGIEIFKKNCWPQECKREIDKMRRLGVRRARARGRKYLFNDSIHGMFI
jgi:hypothetical protein